MRLDDVLATRRRIAAASGRLEELVPLGALLADLERFDEAEAVYRRSFQAYGGVSPFPPAWVCFQLGMLWGELVPEPDLDVAALWYRRAIAYLPDYVKARVHLAEIYTSQDKTGDAEALLMPALSSGDPEVRWRLADVLAAQERFEEAEIQLEAARSGFEELVAKHLFAFADHAAEFYAGSGNDFKRALELARANVANRPTRRAVKQAHAIAVNADRSRPQATNTKLATREYTHDNPRREVIKSVMYPNTPGCGEHTTTRHISLSRQMVGLILHNRQGAAGGRRTPPYVAMCHLLQVPAKPPWPPGLPKGTQVP